MTIPIITLSPVQKVGELTRVRIVDVEIHLFCEECGAVAFVAEEGRILCSGCYVSAQLNERKEGE